MFPSDSGLIFRPSKQRKTVSQAHLRGAAIAGCACSSCVVFSTCPRLPYFSLFCSFSPAATSEPRVAAALDLRSACCCHSLPPRHVEMCDPALSDEDFGQRVDLTVRIREVLASYPAGLSILKELLQNADDAGASVLKLCFDQRQHATQRMAYPGLAAFQGPALLAYNDAEFTAADFASIQSIGNSGKRAGDSAAAAGGGASAAAGVGASTAPPKTGRFGLGFNSSYHMTDVPSFVSGSYIAYFDPHATNLPLSNVNNPGKRINFLSGAAAAGATASGESASTAASSTPAAGSSSSLLDRYPDQFAPLVAFGCTLRSHFAGTLFRFPLRTQAQSLTSKLSKHAYTSEHMEELLRSMYVEASEMLLFLKHVTRIEIYRWRPDAAAPICEFSVHIANLTPTLKQHRAFLTTCTQVMLQKLTADVDFLDEIELTSERFDHSCQDASDASSSSAAAVPSRRSTDTWLVANKLSAGTALRMAQNPLYDHFRFLPWGGCAACLKRGGAFLQTSDQQIQGRAYCFLPLPVQTAFPIHVNAFFELSSNRRDVWWQNGGARDMVGDGLVRSQWNEALCTELIAPAYASLLARAARMLSEAAPDAFYALFPSQLKTSEAWLVTIARLYAILQDSPLLLTRTPNWKPAASGGAGASAGRTEPALNGAGTWLCPRDAITVDEYLPCEVDRTITNEDGSETIIPASVAPFELIPSFGPIASLLLACGLPVVRMPSKLQRMLVLYAPKGAAASGRSASLATVQPIGPRHVDPGFIRTWLVQLGALPSVLSRTHGLFLLQFALSDLNTAQPSNFLKLVGLPLLPLLRGGFAKFAPKQNVIAGMAVAQPAGAAAASSNALPLPATFFVLSSSDLRHNVPAMLSAASHALLATDLAPAVAKVLADPAVFNVLNLAPLTETAFANELLKFCVPQSWKGVDVVEWKPPAAAIASSASAATAAASSSSSVMATVPYSVPSREFLSLLWAYVSRCKDLSLFTMYPLVLTHPGFIGDQASASPLLCRLTKATHLLHPGSSEMLSTPFSPLLCRALCKLRLHVLDTTLAPSLSLPHPSLFDLGFVAKPSSLPSFVAMLVSLCQNDPTRLPMLVQECMPQERKTIRKWIGALVGRTAGKPLQPIEVNWLKALPLFQVYPDHKPFARRSKPLAAAAAAAGSDASAAMVPAEVTVEDEWTEADESSSFVDLASAPRLLPPPTSFVAPHLLSSRFLLLSLSSDLALLTVLGATTISAADFFVGHLFPGAVFSRMHAGERDETMERVLSDASTLGKQSATFLSALAGLAFLPTAGGGLNKVCELYDPEVEDLHQLLEASMHFPQPPFNSPTNLRVLRTLGLQNQLDRNGVFESAVSIYKIALGGQAALEGEQSSTSSKSPSAAATPAAASSSSPAPVVDDLTSQALVRSKALLHYVDSHAARLFVDDGAKKSGGGDIPKASWLSSLLSVPWLPVLVKAPSQALPWNEQLVHGPPGAPRAQRDPPFLASPKDTRPQSTAWHCSYSMRMLDSESQLSTPVLSHFEWDKPLPIKVIVTQLLQLSAKLHSYGPPASEVADSAAPLSDAERTRLAEQRDLLEQLSSILPQLYRLLSHSVSDASSASSAETLATLRSSLHGEEWLFMGDRFIQSDKVAFSTAQSVNIDCEPCKHCNYSHTVA